ADEEVEARDRRVLHEIVPAEDHRAAQVRPEDEAAGGRLEVALHELRIDALELFLRIAGQARLVERLPVGVGAVDLHALAERVGAHRLGEEHGDRIGLLAGGAAGGPDAHEVVRALRLQELRHDVGLQEIPRRLVAEERGDIDEDGIEELHELLGMDLEVFDVAVEAVDAGELHAARDAAYEARSFVTGKVEAALLLQE